MVKKSYSKPRTETEIQKIKRMFPDYDKTELTAIYSIDGKIIKLVTKNLTLQAILKSEGFLEN